VNETFSLGRIAGVRVGLHWSVLVIVVLIALALARGRLPAAHPGHSALAYCTLGVLSSLVFLASLLAHELAHAIVARRNNVQVDGITLWMLGGAARLRSEAPTPGAELRIAAVGPLTSALAGGVFAGLAVGLDALHVSGLVVEAVAWLAGINIVLALFNSLPAAPLDGGRLLRSFLWWRTGDRLRATRGASAAGRALGWLMVATGVAGVLFAGNFSGMWGALVGWFLIVTASAEARQAQLRGVLNGIPVSRVMTRVPVSAPSSVTIAEFLAEAPFDRYRHAAFPVLAADGSVAGLVTVDLIDHVPVPDRTTTTIGDVMRPLPGVETAGPDDMVMDLLPRLDASEQGRALVLDEEGHLVGIVTRADISRIVAWLNTTGPTRR